MAVTETVENQQPNIVHRWAGTHASSAIAETTGAVTRPLKFSDLTLKLDAAPTTSENFTVTLDSANGPEYDTLLFSLDLSTSSVTDLVLDESDFDVTLMSGDALDIAYTNTDAAEWGLHFTMTEGGE